MGSFGRNLQNEVRKLHSLAILPHPLSEALVHLAEGSGAYHLHGRFPVADTQECKNCSVFGLIDHGSYLFAAAHAQQLSIRDRILDRCLVGLFSMQTQITILTALYLRTGRLTITSGRLTIIARRRGGNSRALVRITSVFTSYFIQNMRGFLFILSVLLILCCFTADRFQRWQDDVIFEGPCVAFAFTHKH